MRVLVVTPFPVLPRLHGSRARTAGLAEGLARAGAKVDVLCPWHPRQRVGRSATRFALRPHFLAANVLPLLVSERLASPLALLSLQPRRGAARRLRALGEYDVVQLELCAQAAWVDLFPAGAKLVYSAHNVERDYWAHEAGYSPLARLSLRRIERLERVAITHSDLLVACSGEDVQRLGELYGPPRRSLVVHHGCDTPLSSSERAALRARARPALGLTRDKRAIVFIGGNARHNREAVSFLLAHVLPRLGRDARLIVVGRSGDGRRSGDQRVCFTGFVTDVRPYLAAADVGVNPVEHASGSSVKLAEYLAAGLPVIATAAGARGIAAPPGRVRVVERAAFADALVAPLPEASPDAGAAAPTWDTRGAELAREYARLLA